MLDNDMVFSASEGSINVASGLRQCSLYTPLNLIMINPCRVPSYVTSCSSCERCQLCPFPQLSKVALVDVGYVD
jgi:hypothetical protein